MRVTQLRVYWRHKKTEERHEIKIPIPKGTSVPEMKIMVADKIKKYERYMEYYYVTAVVRKPDGTNGYRNIVPKIVLI